MSSKCKVLILAGNGINCERETENAFDIAGASETKIIHINDLKVKPSILENYHLLALPGGFSYGDHIFAGIVLATDLKYSLYDPLIEFIEAEKLIIGICNGFQVQVRTGLLPGINKEYTRPIATLAPNSSSKFEDRWVHLVANPNSPCVFTKGIKVIYLPVRHGEGRFVPKNKEINDHLKKKQLIALQYADEKGNITNDYPYNPNGSTESIAGICDPTGRIFGLMPHPEAFCHPTNHPFWSRLSKSERKAQGLLIFQNAVKYVKNYLV
ncbi:MAG: phosphoribosylformylglycinamidine synthase I [Candidatus Hodarchaeota archaeon]